MQKNGESRFSLSFVRCLPIVAVLRRGIHNLTLGFCGRSNLRRCFASCVSLRYTMERMRTSSFALSRKHNSPRIPHKEIAKPEIRTAQKAHLRKNEIVELCEAFHCERCFPELHSPQSLMSTLPLSEALPSLNAPALDKMILPHLSRRCRL